MAVTVCPRGQLLRQCARVLDTMCPQSVTIVASQASSPLLACACADTHSYVLLPSPARSSALSHERGAQRALWALSETTTKQLLESMHKTSHATAETQGSSATVASTTSP